MYNRYKWLLMLAGMVISIYLISSRILDGQQQEVLIDGYFRDNYGSVVLFSQSINSYCLVGTAESYLVGGFVMQASDGGIYVSYKNSYENVHIKFFFPPEKNMIWVVLPNNQAQSFSISKINGVSGKMEELKVGGHKFSAAKYFNRHFGMLVSKDNGIILGEFINPLLKVKHDPAFEK